MNNNIPPNPTALGAGSIKEFAGKVSRYFLDFLQTDFKVQKAPRRRIHLKTESGFRTGVPLRKYESLYKEVWKLLDKPISENQSLFINRGKHKSPVSPVLRKIIHEYIDSIKTADFDQVRRVTIEAIKRNRAKAADDPEAFVESMKLEFVEAVQRTVVSPFLALLDGHFQNQAYSAVESIFEIQSDLIDALCAPVLEQLPGALSKYVVNSNLKPSEEILEKLFSEDEIKERLQEFFEDFSSSDAYQELRDVTHYARTGGQNLQIYLYVCDLKFGSVSYPLFYIPVTIEFEDNTGMMKIKLEPHLYVHKNAVDFILQETTSKTTLAVSPIDNRIIYLGEDQQYLSEMGRVLGRMSVRMDLTGDFDINKPTIEAQESARVKLTKSVYFAAFDRADESLINDYEALLAAIDEDQQAVTELFEDMIRAIITDDPISVREDVEKSWQVLEVPDRLIAVSPIPLNEEQRLVFMALADPRCRFIALQGPPGTGKSHTITAIAFDCIQHGKNVLVLSDKNEALDVVEDKLSKVLSSVRDGEDFPNPILRLGRTGGTYARLISQTAQEKIRVHYAAIRTSADELAKETVDTTATIKKGIRDTIEAYAGVRFIDIEKLLALEEKLSKFPDHVATLQGMDRPDQQIFEVLNYFAKHPEALESLNDAGTVDYIGLRRIVTARAIVYELRDYRKYQASLRLFKTLRPNQLGSLRQFIFKYDALKLPIVGYLFSGARVKQLNALIAAEIGCVAPYDLHRRVNSLKEVEQAVMAIQDAAERHKVTDDVTDLVYGHLAGKDVSPGEESLFLWRMLKLMYARFPGYEPKLAALHIGPAGFKDIKSLLQFIYDSLVYARLWFIVNNIMSRPPEFDYVREKSKLERLYTVQMTHQLDKRFIKFVDDKKATAKSLAGVIRAKQRFPLDKFESLKQAFPCVIAGIREFAEYVPLQKEIFDVVVIDEASQVSIAQAFPAILRARKVVVLGDRKQFSNVKSMQASIAQNNGYVTDLEDVFRRRISTASDKIMRLKQFDVKKSVLEFFELCSNYSGILRKHFRGYQELISFSSEHFYEGQLQAIKVRGKPIEDVIRFTVLTPAETTEVHRSVNTAEGNYILERLRELVTEGALVTVGIITPFREQQQYLTKMLFNDAQGAVFEEKLKLKIMTFDSCQGEERDLILYSLVATATQDLLNYIFPVELDRTEERVEEMLKMQRLNVGFSRAKECVHFVLSKEIGMFTGSIGRVLNHYHQLLLDKSLPEAADTDPTSPMEAKVLDWVTKTPFYQRNAKRIELHAQFPIGEYLRQLDPTYQHPAYRVDFLMRYREDGTMANVIIEYDGFLEHFTNHHQVHVGNYESFYRPQDLERQMVLESYGYKFLRINRFNLGKDPVATLSARLAKLVDSATTTAAAGAGVSKMLEKVSSVENGDGQICRKCGHIHPKDNYYDKRLKDGAGGYGYVCNGCKRKRRK